MPAASIGVDFVANTARWNADIERAKSVMVQNASQINGALSGVEGRFARTNRSAGQLRAGMQQLSFQVGDVGASMASGTKPMVIFAQQIGQVGQAIQMMSGGSSKFAAFLGGPWGAAITAAISVAGGLYAAHQRTTQAAKEAEKAHESLADKLNLQKHSYEEVTKAIREYNGEQRQSRQLALDAAQATLTSVRADLEKVISLRKRLKAELELSQWVMTHPSGGSPDEVAVQQAAMTSLGQSLREQIAQNDNELRAAQAGVQNAVVGVASEMAKIASDPHYAIEQRFKRLREQASGSIKDVKKLADELAKLNRQEQAAYEKLSKDGRTLNPLSVSATDVARALGVTPTSTIRSAAHNRDVGGAVNSFHLSGQAIDFPVGRWSKELIRATLERAGIRILELLGPGDKGHSDHFHVAFAKTRRSPEDVADAAERARVQAAEKAEREREQAIRRQKAFDDQLAALDTDLIQARRANTIDAGELADFARDEVRVAADKLTLDIEAKKRLGDYTDEQADELESKVRQVKAQKLLTIDIQETQRLADEALRFQMAANDNERDILSIAEGLATTAKERREISLRLLDLDMQEERARQEAVIASKTATDAEKKIAQARLNALGDIYGGRRESVMKQTAGPMEDYLSSLPHTADEVNEALQRIKADGLQAFTDGLVDAIVNFRSLGDVAKNVLAQIAADLLRLQIQKAIFSIIGGSLGGSGGGLAADAASTIASNPQLFANGTTGAPGGWAFVGERGPELVNLRPGQQVIPNHRLPQMMAPQFGRAGNDNFTLNVHVNGAMNEKHARETGDQVGRAIRRQLNGPVRVR